MALLSCARLCCYFGLSRPVNSGVRRLSFFEENMTIESSPSIVSTTVVGLW